jgi:phosphate transport system protein
MLLNPARRIPRGEVVLMPREGFDRQLRGLQHEVLTLGSMVATAVERAIVALRERNALVAETVIADDSPIDVLANRIEERALLIIAMQQPLATDLRMIASVIAIAAELERIGDYAEGIAKLALLNLDEPPIKPLIDLPLMASMAVDMLRRCLDAFINGDAIAAREIWDEDDAIDLLQGRIYRELLTCMSGDGATIERGTRLLWISHNVERIADRVTNICERIIFTATGDRSHFNASHTS